MSLWNKCGRHGQFEILPSGFAWQGSMQSDRLQRREFIALIGGASAAWPLTGRAQQLKPRIGLVSIGADPSNPVIFIPFLQQMRDLGYIDGQNVVFERRFAAGRDDLINGFVTNVLFPQFYCNMTAKGARAAFSLLAMSFSE